MFNFLFLRKRLFFFPLLFSATLSLAQVGIGTVTPDVSSALDVTSTTKGVLIPRLNNAQVTVLAGKNPVEGLLVYNTSEKCIQIYTGAAFQCLVAGAAPDTTNDSWKDNTPNKQVRIAYLSDGVTARPDSVAFAVDDSGRVGIGLTNPAGLLDIKGKIYVNHKQTLYNAGELNSGFRNSLFVGDGGQKLSTGGFSNTAKDNIGVGYGSLKENTTGYSNTAIGSNSLNENTSGSNNTSIGINSLKENRSGGSNTAIGSGALDGNTTGGSNTAIGSSALGSNTLGNDNTAIGVQSLASTTNTGGSTAIGYQALRYNTSGGNTAIGALSLSAGSSGNGNTAVGQYAMENTTGSGNVAIGSFTMRRNTTGFSNTALGQQALLYNETGFYNTALGAQSLYRNKRGFYNSALGAQSLYNDSTGSRNTAIGYNAGKDLNGSERNTFIGYNTGRDVVTGTGNTILGADVTGLDSAISNNIIIADGDGNQRIRVLGDGKTGINQTDPTSTLDIRGSLATGIRSASGILTSDDSYIIATGTITLPNANSCTGREYHIKNTGTATTISTYYDTSGSSTTTLPASSVIHLVSDGTDWQQF